MCRKSSFAKSSKLLISLISCASACASAVRSGLSDPETGHLPLQNIAVPIPPAASDARTSCQGRNTQPDCLPAFQRDLEALPRSFIPPGEPLRMRLSGWKPSNGRAKLPRPGLEFSQVLKKKTSST